MPERIYSIYKGYIYIRERARGRDRMACGRPAVERTLSRNGLFSETGVISIDLPGGDDETRTKKPNVKKFFCRRKRKL